MIRILIVEDMILLQESLANIVNGQEDMEVAGVTANADEALILCRETNPDLALIDVVMEDKASGIAVAAEIRREMPNIKIVIMTALPEITFIDAARKAGAHSFVYKSSDCQHLLYVIRSTMKDKGIYPGPGEEGLTKISFSDAEIAVIRLVYHGKQQNEIIQALSVSEDRVKELISSILNKTGFDSITKFSIYAVANGFIVPIEQSIHASREESLQKACIKETGDFEEPLDANDAVQNNVDLSAFYEFKLNVKNLSRTERVIFSFYTEGYSAAEVAKKLFVSLDTIKWHNKNIYRKLKISSLKELRVYAQMIKASD